MSHPYLDSPITGVHDYPEDAVCTSGRAHKLFTIKTPKGTRVWSPDLELLKRLRAALWPSSYKTKLPRYTITEARRG